MTAVPNAVLPPHLLAEGEAAIARIEAAGTRLEKAAAMEHGRAVQERLENYRRGLSAAADIRSIHRRPKQKMGL